METYNPSQAIITASLNELKNLDFVKEQLITIPENRDSLDKYGKLKAQTAKDICQTILSQIS